MATETTKILIKPLNGANYATWKVQCNMTLIREELWNIVTGNENAPQNQGEQEEFLLQRDHPLATIVLSMDPMLLYLLGPDPENPSVVWKKLAGQFQKRIWAKKIDSTKKVVQFEAERGRINAETC